MHMEKDIPFPLHQTVGNVQAYGLHAFGEHHTREKAGSLLPAQKISFNIRCTRPPERLSSRKAVLWKGVFM